MSNFVTQLSEQIGERFRGLCDVFPLLNACDPTVARVNGIKSLVPLFSRFPQLIKESDFDICSDEWRSLTFHEDAMSASGIPAEFWCSVRWRELRYCIDGTPLFPNMANFMLGLLHSSAAVEGIFSQAKLQKTDIRNKHRVSKWPLT